MDLVFERPGDENLTWVLDNRLTPLPVRPLTQSTYNYMFQDYQRVQRLIGQERPAVLRTLFVRGYLYVHATPAGSPLPEAGREALRQSPVKWEQEWLPEIRANLDRLNGIDLGALPDDALSHTLQDANKAFARHWAIHHSLSFMAADELVDWYMQRFPETLRTDALKLVQGQTTWSVDSHHELRQLSRQVTSDMAQSLDRGDRAALPSAFGEALDRYLLLHGRRPPVACDLGRPTWLEDPTPVMQAILRYAREGAPDPYESVRALAAERESLTARVRAPLTDDERARFDALHVLALSASRAREDRAYWIELQTTAALRRVCVEMGRRMATVRILNDAADVAFLTLPELLRFGFGVAQPHLRGAVTERKAEHAANLQGAPAPWVGTAPK